MLGVWCGDEEKRKSEAAINVVMTSFSSVRRPLSFTTGAVGHHPVPVAWYECDATLLEGVHVRIFRVWWIAFELLKTNYITRHYCVSAGPVCLVMEFAVAAHGLSSWCKDSAPVWNTPSPCVESCFVVACLRFALLLNILILVLVDSHYVSFFGMSSRLMFHRKSS